METKNYIKTHRFKSIEMRSTIKLLYVIIALFLIAGCKESDDKFEEPYKAGQAPLGVTINTAAAPVPANGLPGMTVQVAATGLLPYKDKIIFTFNGKPAEILEVTVAGIKIKVPDNASSGVTSILIDDKIIFGPTFTVQGLIATDPTFVATQGADGAVTQALKLIEGKYMMVGNFTNYDNKGVVTPNNRIVRTFLNGNIDRTLRAGLGANGFLSGITQLGSQFYIVGAFSGFNQRKENISNITRLNGNGSIDTMGIKTFRPPGKPDTIKYFPRFNGGTDGGISEIYTFQGRLIATGDFRYYISRRYDRPNRYQTNDSVILDSTEARQIIRFNPDATLDKTYRFDPGTNKSLPGANGNVNSIMHPGSGGGANDGKLLIFGSFTTFDNTQVGRISRLKIDGNIDPTFNPGGAGANLYIGSADFNQSTGKYVITGEFRTYNGSIAANIARLNIDGTLDGTFVPKAFSGGSIRGAKQLSNGLIVIYGDFKKYGDYTRNGFAILTPSGELAPGFNATGIFNGNLHDVIETESEDGKKALLLIGEFDRFDNNKVRNIIRVTIE